MGGLNYPNLCPKKSFKSGKKIWIGARRKPCRKTPAKRGKLNHRKNLLAKKASPQKAQRGAAQKKQRIEERINNLRKDGWQVVEILHGKAKVGEEKAAPDEEIRVEGFGTTFYILKRKKGRQHDEPNDDDVETVY